MEEPSLVSVNPHEQTWQERAQKAIWTFLTIAAAIIFYHLLQYLGTISAFIGKVFHGMSPVLWGLVFAYLLAPVAGFYERNITEIVMRNKAKNGKSVSIDHFSCQAKCFKSRE